MSCGRSSRMSIFSRSRWMLTEQTVIRVRINLVQHTKLSSDRDKTWPPITPRAQEAEGDIQQLTPTPESDTQRLGEQMQYSGNEVTQRCPQMYVSPTSKYQFSERHVIQYHTHGLRMWACCQSFTSMMPRLGLARIETPDMTKSSWGGLSPGSTNN